MCWKNRFLYWFYTSISLNSCCFPLNSYLFILLFHSYYHYYHYNFLFFHNLFSICHLNFVLINHFSCCAFCNLYHVCLFTFLTYCIINSCCFVTIYPMYPVCTLSGQADSIAQVDDMEAFLRDYGLQWIGYSRDNAASPNADSSENGGICSSLIFGKCATIMDSMELSVQLIRISNYFIFIISADFQFFVFFSGSQSHIQSVSTSTASGSHFHYTWITAVF